MLIHVSDEVQEALDNHQPVVALETTIISHGMPYPTNVETALKVEETIRSFGVVPATIGIIDGIPTVGMNKEQIEEFGTRKGIKKVSRRDLASVCANKQWGATTVSGTMIIAKEAGIKVFVTGGIGGVHRGAETTMDISADLEELAQTNVAVVCAGPKAILDLGLTLEYLETKGVTIVGYQTNELPAFYTRESGYPVDVKCDSPKEIADLIKMKNELHLEGGMLIANPIPQEYAMNKLVMDYAIDQAIEEANEKGIKGKDLTPFLLSRISDITGGESLESNIHLIMNNAVLGAQLALELEK
ncbi:MAG: pseudouridine-5'-phosphate glycosidase [Coprobacillus sp.]|nr:pseudouridine-5'-phosphate glycosidase [Coprobacillus sp.]